MKRGRKTTKLNQEEIKPKIRARIPKPSKRGIKGTTKIFVKKERKEKYSK